MKEYVFSLKTKKRENLFIFINLTTLEKMIKILFIMLNIKGNKKTIEDKMKKVVKINHLLSLKRNIYNADCLS